MLQVFYFQYEVQPLPNNEYFATAGGAYVNCYVVAASAENAAKLAQANFIENSWAVVAVQDEPVITAREDFFDDSDTLQCFDEAVSNGECYVFHLWPLDPQEDDAIH